MNHAFIKIPVWIDLPADRHEDVPKARYALAHLLHICGFTPIWIDSGATANGQRFLHYSTAPSEQAIPLPAVLKTFHPDEIGWLADAETQTKVPVPFAENGVWDWVQSTFFWLSDAPTQYVTARDAHGRLCYADALQAYWGVEPLPFVAYYAEQLRQTLEAHGIIGSPPQWQGKRWAFCMTHDVDHIRKWTPRMWLRLAWRHTDWIRFHDGFSEGLRQLLHHDRAAKIRATWFFKAGATAPEDTAYRLNARSVQRLFRQLSRDGHEIGLHPSYFAHHHAAYMQAEAVALRSATAQTVTSVRQHYLRWDERHTPQLHAASGFSAESTLSFVDRDGFRNATCHPFQLWDWQHNAPFPVWEVPLCLHDTTLLQYRALSPDAALDRSRFWMAEVRRWRGVCVGLWHNVIYDEALYPQWSRHFEATARLVGKSDAAALTIHEAIRWCS